MGFQKVMVTGGAGYVGSLLVPQLLQKGLEVTVYDTLYFGSDFLPLENPNLTVVQGDIRDIEIYKSAVEGQDAIIHLACISNDASFDLNEDLSTSINFNAFEPLVIEAKKAKVRRFIYASSSSVYGVSEAPDVTEEHPLVPLTLYNEYKGLCEPLLFKHMTDDFVCVTIRPATVCGYAPRQRLDLTVNILTHHAIKNGVIKVFGGEQLRPNLHIQDMCDLYKLLLTATDEKIKGETFNVGYQNMSVMHIAKLVKEVVAKEFPRMGEIDIVKSNSDDNRSYHINNDKIARRLNFNPQHSVEDAVRDLCAAFKSDKLPNSMTDDRYYNVKHLKALNAK